MSKALEFLEVYGGKKAEISRLAARRDDLKKQIANLDADLKEMIRDGLKDGVLQIGCCYEVGGGRVAVVYTTERGPQLSFFDKAT